MNHLKLYGMSRRRTGARSEATLLQERAGPLRGKIHAGRRGIHLVTLFAEGNAGKRRHPW
jgi:hypothetical protein